MMFSDHL